MKRTLPKRSNLFLMEMIIAILFFALASAVCMQFFAKSKILSMETSAKNHAMIVAKSAASSPPAAGRTSIITFLSSFSSFGKSNI